MTIPIDTGKDYLVWTFDFALSTFYEVETDRIHPLLPHQLAPMEVAPGVSLISVTAFNFPEGALESLPEFQELIFSAVVSPDLTRGVPKFAMYVISLASTSQAHMDHSLDYYKLPAYHPVSDVEIKSRELDVRYADSKGTILTMNNCSGTMDYKEDERYMQVFTGTEDSIYVADLYIKASLYEHQQSGEVGKLFPHPFFQQLDIEEADPVAFLQMISEPGKKGQQFYFRPERFR